MAIKDLPAPSEASSNLGQVAAQFLLTLSPDERLKSQQEIYRFVRWYGEGRRIGELSIPEVANYAEQITSSTTEIAEKLAIVKAFLIYSYKQGLTKTNLSLHLKPKRPTPKLHARPSRLKHKEAILTAKGRADLEAELTALKSERPIIAEELQKAAADKDFRENAPLEAARERQGQLEARIRELEGILKAARDMEEKQTSGHQVNMGDTVLLRELTSSEEVKYTLVDAREANPIDGKISTASPVGQALLGRNKGDTIDVRVPAGVITYEIKDILHR
ncbi:MAG: transcription elongation factor GreA [Chloroflexi bacterium]|nr:transcription elongation factor GreA [Chloroflexota bacterium]MBM3174500.1 transcription elongation factor GreA [Chloroflexota bacterium]MBM4449657.1 transcription elongation factor GreA [Chloroflexota bacterium]